MRLSDSFLEQLRANTDIESVISPYVNLRRRGKNLVYGCKVNRGDMIAAPSTMTDIPA